MRWHVILLLVAFLSCSTSKVEVEKGARYDAQEVGVPMYPGARVKGKVVSESRGRRVITYVLTTKSPYDSVVSFYLRRANGTDSAAAGQIYTINRGTELLIQIKEEGDHREIDITRAVPVPR